MRIRNLVLISAAAFATAVIVRKLLESRSTPAISNLPNQHEYDVDAEDDDSFPASDPPSWSGGHYH
ncbi:hypothetical protein ACLVWU_04720 [Bdellovibrio sp. HCB290]|uniref:hypothetical protein n=1 Tax=Bdellovibrio sp. HCB290 TaxID=3394356 RepID=UPI0039B582BD